MKRSTSIYVMHSAQNTSGTSNRAAPSGTTPNEQAPASRSIIVTLLGLLFAFTTVVMFMISLMYLAEIGLFTDSIAKIVQQQLKEEPNAFLVLRAFATTGLAFCYLITTIGIFRRRPWAWNASMVLLGLELALGLADYLEDSQTLPNLFITVIAVFLLNQHSIRKAFRVNEEKRDTTVEHIHHAGHSH